MRVLIADDEERYRTYLRASLAERGHEVTTVDTGRTAIDHGIRFRPNVLVADWMLRNHIHGLDVSEVLQAVNPTLQTILITGFASSDLKDEARTAGVAGFLEKPFELEEMVEALDDLKRARPSSPKSLCALVEVESSGKIVWTNDRAATLFLESGLPAPPDHLGDLFGTSTIGMLVEANEEWRQVQPIHRPSTGWWARSRTWPDGGILVLLPEGKEKLQRDRLVELLLDTESETSTEWPLSHHVLVIDDAKQSRALCARLLEQAGCVCYKADSRELAVKLFRADPEIGVVITDHDVPGGDIEALVSELRAIRPGVRIVGSSQEDLRRAFSAVGVDLYLEKRWDLPDLVELLQDD